jgi:hypothetical protein
MKFEEAPEIITPKILEEIWGITRKDSYNFFHSKNFPKIKLDGSDKLLANKYAVRRWSIQNMIYDPAMFYENLKES